MDNAISITIALVVSLSVYLAFYFALKDEKMRRYLRRHRYFHPNAICIWRVLTGFAGTLLSPGTEGIIHSLLMGMAGLGLYFYRRRQVA